MLHCVVGKPSSVTVDPGRRSIRAPEPLDLAMVMGAGFPPFRGGLLRYADSIGLESVVKKLQELESQVGPRFRPPEALVRKARGGKGFYA